MDLEVARKSLSKRSAFSSSKRVAFLAVAGLVLVAGIALRATHYFGQLAVEEQATPGAVETPEPAAPPPTVTETTTTVPETPPAASLPETAPATPPTAATPSVPAEPAGAAVEQPAPDGAAVEQAEQPELPGSGMILVSKRPVEVLASPSPDASAMFGFPAGRPFRVIGREAGFAKIQDLRSGASGWIDEAALAPPPPRVPAVASPSQPSQTKPGAAGRKPTTASANPKAKATTKTTTQVTSESEPAAETGSVQPQKRPGLFGRGGLFGGIFGGGNQPQ